MFETIRIVLSCLSIPAFKVWKGENPAQGIDDISQKSGSVSGYRGSG